MNALNRIAALALLIGLAACSTAATPAVPPETGNGALSNPARERHGKLVLRFKVPKKHHGIRVVRNGRPRYVSPSTQSLSLSITGPTNVSEAVGLTVDSGNCTSTLTSTFCTLTIPGLAVGTGYQISVATYDGPIVGNAPSGNVLSKNQNVGFAIVAGQLRPSIMPCESTRTVMRFSGISRRRSWSRRSMPTIIRLSAPARPRRRQA
jgi:hypothetical protein